MITDKTIDTALESISGQLIDSAQGIENECSRLLTNYDDVFFFADQVEKLVKAAKELIEYRKNKTLTTFKN